MKLRSRRIGLINKNADIKIVQEDRKRQKDPSTKNAHLKVLVSKDQVRKYLSRTVIAETTVGLPQLQYNQQLDTATFGNHVLVVRQRQSTFTTVSTEIGNSENQIKATNVTVSSTSNPKSLVRQRKSTFTMVSTEIGNSENQSKAANATVSSTSNPKSLVRNRLIEDITQTASSDYFDEFNIFGVENVVGLPENLYVAQRSRFDPPKLEENDVAVIAVSNMAITAGVDAATINDSVPLPRQPSLESVALAPMEVDGPEINKVTSSITDLLQSSSDESDPDADSSAMCCNSQDIGDLVQTTEPPAELNVAVPEQQELNRYFHLLMELCVTATAVAIMLLTPY